MRADPSYKRNKMWPKLLSEEEAREARKRIFGDTREDICQNCGEVINDKSTPCPRCHFDFPKKEPAE